MLYLIWIRPFSGAPTSGQSGPGRDDNKGLLRIPQSSSTAGTSPSDCLVSYPENSYWGLTKEAVGVFYSPSQLGKKNFGYIPFPRVLT